MIRSEGLPSYLSIAQRYGVELCYGEREDRCAVSEDHHRTGFVRHGTPPTIHWQLRSLYVKGEDRMVTRRGIYRVLKLIFWALNQEVLNAPKWERTWRAAKFAIEAALSMGVRIGRPATELDRATIRFALRDPQERDTKDKEKAWRWAENRYD